MFRFTRNPSLLVLEYAPCHPLILIESAAKQPAFSKIDCPVAMLVEVIEVVNFALVEMAISVNDLRFAW